MGEIGRLSAHKTIHQDGGPDEISVEGLAGDLADAQESTWARVSDKPTMFDPAAHKTSHQDGGSDEIDATGLVGTGKFVDRGDPSAYDFTTASFTTDGTWRNLDLSSLVPSGALAVLIKVLVQDDAAQSLFVLRKDGNVNDKSAAGLYTQVANIYFSGLIVVPLPSTRIIEYLATNTVWDVIYIAVMGWWI